MFRQFAVVLLVVVSQVWGHHFDCSTLMPRGMSEQNAIRNSVFQIHTDNHEYSIRDTVTLTFIIPADKTIKDFALQVRQPMGNVGLGMFEINDDSKFEGETCPRDQQGPPNTVTKIHSDANALQRLVIKWRPPPNADGRFHAQATVVDSDDTLYIIESILFTVSVEFGGRPDRPDRPPPTGDRNREEGRAREDLAVERDRQRQAEIDRRREQMEGPGYTNDHDGEAEARAAELEQQRLQDSINFENVYAEGSWRKIQEEEARAHQQEMEDEERESERVRQEEERRRLEMLRWEIRDKEEHDRLEWEKERAKERTSTRRPHRVHNEEDDKEVELDDDKNIISDRGDNEGTTGGVERTLAAISAVALAIFVHFL